MEQKDSSLSGGPCPRRVHSSLDSSIFMSRRAQSTAQPEPKRRRVESDPHDDHASEEAAPQPDSAGFPPNVPSQPADPEYARAVCLFFSLNVLLVCVFVDGHDLVLRRTSLLRTPSQTISNSCTFFFEN